MRLSIIGGGGFRVPLVYRALLTDSGNEAPGERAEVVLYDASPDRARVIANVLRAQAAHAPDAPAVRVAPTLDDALMGADFVFCAIRVDGTPGRVRDERVPLSHGVLGQETVGAGGVLYGLRTIPVVLDIAKRVRAVAPRAWVINFTNPAGMVTEAMSAVLGHRVIGICDSPVGLVRRAARAVGVDPAEVTFDYVGLNHLGWLRSLNHQRRDLLPGLLADPAALESIEEGRLFGSAWLRALGSLPNEYLRYYYFRRESLAEALTSDETRGEFLDRQQRTFFTTAAEFPDRALELWERARLEREETYQSHARTGGRSAADTSTGHQWERDPRDLGGGGYDQVALELMRAIGADRRTRLVLNVRNAGTVPQLPDDAIIETVCEAGAEGAHPVPCASPGTAELGLMLQVKAVERAVIEAASTGSAEAALRALAQHPLVDSPAVAARILTDAGR